MSPLGRSDPDPISSIILEGQVHKDAMLSTPFNPNPVAKSKEEAAERILLVAEHYPSASNGVSVSLKIAGVQRKAMLLVGGAAWLFKSFLGSGGGTIRVDSRSSTPVPGAPSSGNPMDVHFEEGVSASGCRSGDPCEVLESEARALFGKVVERIPSLSSSTFVEAAVRAERDVQAVLSEIMADLASAEELNGDVEEGEHEGNLDKAEGSKSDAVLITVCSCLAGDGTGFIEMRPVPACGDRSEQQDYEVSHTGSRF